MTYDWRLSVPMLEQLDGYFTKLKATVEITCKLQNQKVKGGVLLSNGCCLTIFAQAD